MDFGEVDLGVVMYENVAEAREACQTRRDLPVLVHGFAKLGGEDVVAGIE